MWPKALIELLPHLTRLVPLANRYFQSKSTADDARQLALERKLDETAAALRRDFGNDVGKAIAEASAAQPLAEIARQLTRQAEALTETSAALRAMQSELESIHTQVESVDTRWTNTLLSLTLALTVGVCILLVLVLVKLHK